MERDALEALASLLDRLGIRWMLIGALAANRYRITTPRRALPGGEILRLRHRELGAADLIVAGTDYERGALAP